MNAVFQIIILIFSVILHEVSHGFVALSLGDPTAKLQGRLTLNPVSHIDPLGSIILPLLMYLTTAGAFVFGWAKPVPYNPYNLRGGAWGPAYVAVAGPASNLFIAIIFGMLFRMQVFSPAITELFVPIVVINILLAIFNLIPIPPLDGSKVLFALLPAAWRGIEDFVNRYQLLILLGILFFGWRIIELPVSLLSYLLLGI